jgi:diadenosine tetraphosphate (Ap4A) HIT family hydrolase
MSYRIDMSAWNDERRWRDLTLGESCPICVQGGPRDIVAELEIAWVTAQELAPMRGYACLVFRRHAVEFHDLSADEAAAYMRDVQKLSSAVAAITGAVKMNYEVHGNTLPHLHMHFFPRYRGDPFEGGPIDSRRMNTPVYSGDEYHTFVERLRDALLRGSPRRTPPARRSW